MKRMKFLFSFFFVFILLMIPVKAYAVEFDISKVTIDAYLQPNGNVQVIERFTYDFESEFNGITREIIPKKGTFIKDLQAFENGQPLKIEKENDLYKIYRKGKEETVTIEIHYSIENAIEKFSDGAQFYWPFFDKRNESTYEDLTITIHPPSKTDNVLALGYDTAFNKEKIEEDGIVRFNFGKVANGKNGDIRVIYDGSLFSQLKENHGTIRDEFLAEKNKLMAEYKNFQEKQQFWKNVSIVSIPIVMFIVIGVFTIAFLSSRSATKRIREFLLERNFYIPEEKLSIPATIFFTNNKIFSASMIPAAIFDLIRNGNIQQLDEDTFTIIHRQTKHKHEEILLSLLFDKIGDGKVFRLKDMEDYLKDKKNIRTYEQSIHKWKEEIALELKEKDFYNKHLQTRWALGITSIFIGVIAIFFGIYELYAALTISIISAVSLLMFAIFYVTKNEVGLIIQEEWKLVKERFPSLTEDDWNGLPKHEQTRFIAYGISVEDKAFKKYFEPFMNRIRTSLHASGEHPYMYFNTIYLMDAFHHADKLTSSSSSTSSTSSGGVGGGGGGSGAF